MDGYFANLAAICDLADRYSALVMVDDSHAVGFVGKTGRGTQELHGVMGRVDILTGTLGKALAGRAADIRAAGEKSSSCCGSARGPICSRIRWPPALPALRSRRLSCSAHRRRLRDKLEANTGYFREEMAAHGFNILSGTHPICPIMLGDAALATRMADAMLVEGVYVIGFSYPVVPQGKGPDPHADFRRPFAG